MKHIVKPEFTPLHPLATAMLCLTLTATAQAQTASASAQVTLPKVEVNAKGASAPAPADSYRATTTRATKSIQDPQDIPQAITSVTRQLMEEQQVGSLREALRNVSGLTFNAAEGGRSGDNMMLRGFYTFGDIYLDGVRDTAQYNRETFNTEQVDVLRGAAAMLYGRGQAGGVINQVSKAPLLVDRNKVSATIGTDGYAEILGDFNTKIDDNSGLRINVMKRQEDSWRGNPANGAQPEVSRQGAAIAYAAGIGTQNEFSVTHSQTNNKDKPDYGSSFDSATHLVNTKFPASYYWGVDQNFDNSKTGISTLAHTHRFESGGELKTQLRYGDYDRAYWAKTPSATLAPSATGATGGNATRTASYVTTGLQTDFNKTIAVANMKHELLIGAEYLKEKSYRTTLLNQGTTAAPYYSADVVSTAAPTRYNGDSYAVYAQDSVEFVKNWKLMGGVRRDALKATYSSLTSPALSFSENSTRAGLSYQPSESAHYYLNYSNSFSPTADLYQLSGGEYPAERSKVMELGTKWQLFEGDLALRAALYKANKDWERNTDLESTAAILTKKRVTNGIELEAAGRINSHWEIFSGLALMDAKIKEVAVNKNTTTGVVTSGDARFVGQQARNTPKYTVNVWTSYNLGDGFKIAGGVELKGKRLVYNPSSANASAIFTNGEFTPNTAPAYARYDFMASYDYQAWTLRLNIKNLTNKLYYDALYDNGGFAVPGNRRAATITAEYKF
jgi:catecholate siderophore receptor